MNNRQFIAKQHVKYLWKSLKHTDRITGTGYRDLEGFGEESFWQYEQTPRVT